MVSTRILSLGLLGALLSFGQVVPPPNKDKNLDELLADLSRRLEGGSQRPNPLDPLFAEALRKPNPRVLRLEPPKVCAAPLLEAKPNVQSNMPVIKPPQPLPRMPQLVPPAPPCPDQPGFTDPRETR